MQDVVFLAEILNGPEEALRILNEGHQYAKRSRVADHVIAPEPNHAGNRYRRENFYDRIVDGVGHDRVFVRVHVDGVHFGKLVISAFFAIEELQDDHAADVLLQIRIDSGDGHADAPVGIADLVAEHLGRDANQRKRGET